MTSSHKQADLAKVKYSLEFDARAKKEWDKLGSGIQLQFAKKLKGRLENPQVEADKLRDMPGCYKIKLRSAGYRLVYEVIGERLVITVISVGKREKGRVYDSAGVRLN